MSFSDFILYFFIGVFVGPIVWRALKKKAHPATIEVIALSGIIHFQTDKMSWFRHVADSITAMLERKHPPKALIVRINSPGGTVGASQELYFLFKKVREKGIKVVALFEDVAASGGLYIAMGADYIVSPPGTITGSIGVIIQGLEYSKVLEFLKIKTRTIKSGTFKDILSPTREMTNEDREILEEVVRDTYEQFLKTVADARNLPVETVRSFADGRIFNGKQAKNLGLVDELGGYEEAIAVAMKLAHIPKDKKHINKVDKKAKFLDSLSTGASLKHQLKEIVPEIELLGIPLWLMPRQL